MEFAKISKRAGLLLITLLLSLQVYAKAPVQSKEDIEYLSKKDAEFLGLMDVNEFQGVIQRVYEKQTDLKQADLYFFADTAKIKLDKELCLKQLARIFGPLDKITLKVSIVEIFKTKVGPACEAQALDTYDKKTQIPERRIIVGLINQKPAAILFRLSKKSDTATQQNIRTFWEGLR